MHNFRNQDEDIRDMLEQHNFYGATKQCNEDAATAEKELVTLRLLLIGMIACFILPLVIADLLLVATLGSLLILISSLRLWKEGKMIRWIFAASIIHTLWRVALVVFSYFPELAGSLVVTYIGFCFMALGFAQLIMLCIALRKITWINTHSKIPAALIGYILLFALSFFQVDLLFIARAVIAALVGLYLRDVYNYSNIKNT